MIGAGDMSAPEVHGVLDALAAAGCRAWIGGGWGVDALVGYQTRGHRDLDLAVDADQEAAALVALGELGYVIETDWRPVRVEVVAAGRGRVDLHPVTFDEAGDGCQADLDGGFFLYPAGCFTIGTIAGRRVNCLTIEQQLRFHRGYPPRDIDHADLALLHALAAADCSTTPCRSGSDYSGRVLDLGRVDLDEIAAAMADQTDYEHRWLINPQTGEVTFWTSDTGIDGQHPVDLDELDLVAVDPVPSYVWYQDMADFAERISDERAGRRLARAIDGRGAFRRFKAVLREEYAHLLPAWYAFRDSRGRRRAVEWLADKALIDDDSTSGFLTDHPDPELP